MKDKNKASGFSLLELLVVIALLSVMVSVLIPSIGSNNRKTMDAAESLVLMINMAQQEAIMTSKVWQLVLDLESRNYRFQQLGHLEFEDITTRPLAGDHDLTPAIFGELLVNGQLIRTDKAEVYLFPTGEQDSLQLILKSEDIEYTIAMGPVGPAQLERL